MFWNPLGVAHYRLARTWPRARTSASNALFLAMAHHQLGDTPKARDYFDRAVGWCEQNRGKLSATHQQELQSFRAEAEALLKGPPGTTR